MTSSQRSMKWFHALAAVLAGFCLTNAVPHGVAGIMGETFPSPFGDPPGVGHSSALVNVLWSLANFMIGYVAFRFGRVRPENRASMLFLFVGIVVAAVLCSLSFSGEIAWHGDDISSQALSSPL